MKTRFFLFSTLASLFLFSCKKASTSSDSLGMQFQIIASNPTSLLNTPTAPGVVQWTSGTASVSQIKLEAKKSGQEVEFKSNLTQTVNLFASVATALGSITIPAGSYDEVEFKITADPNGSSPAIELNGTFTPAGGSTTPVKLIVNSALLLKAEQSNVVVSSTNLAAITTIDLSLITAGISQSSMIAAIQTGGVIILSSSSNSNLYNIIIGNLQHSHHVEVGHH